MPCSVRTSAPRTAQHPFSLFSPNGTPDLAVIEGISAQDAMQKASVLLGTVARDLERLALELENDTPPTPSAAWSAFYFANLASAFVESAGIACASAANEHASTASDAAEIEQRLPDGRSVHAVAFDGFHIASECFGELETLFEAVALIAQPSSEAAKLARIGSQLAAEFIGLMESERHQFAALLPSTATHGAERKGGAA